MEGKCPLCHCDLRISRSYMEVSGDSSPEEETKVFMVQEKTCYNPMCEKNGAVIEIIKNLVYPKSRKLKE